MYARVTLTKAQRAALIDCLNTEHESAEDLADALVAGFLRVVADRVRWAVVHADLVNNGDSAATVAMGWSSKTDASATAKQIATTGQAVELCQVKWEMED